MTSLRSHELAVPRPGLLIVLLLAMLLALGAPASARAQTPFPEAAPESVGLSSAALSELAPANHFYTHSRCFDIQQIAIGNQQQPLVEEWAICGACGHMRPIEELNKPEALPACPQCGHDRDSDSQLDKGQHRQFVDLIMKYRRLLESLYQTDEPASTKREQKARLFSLLKQDHDLLKNQWNGNSGYTHWFNQPLNNAQLVSVLTYQDLVPAFVGLLNQKHGDLKQFYNECQALANKTKKERYNSLNKYLEEN